MLTKRAKYDSALFLPIFCRNILLGIRISLSDIFLRAEKISSHVYNVKADDICEPTANQLKRKIMYCQSMKISIKSTITNNIKTYANQVKL